MSLEFRLGAGTGEVGETVTVDRYLYLAEAGDRVVEEGDPEGRWLWATPGQVVPRTEAERLGAAAGKAKQRAPRANKQRARGEDKTGT